MADQPPATTDAQPAPATSTSDDATASVGPVPTEVEDLLNKDILELMGAKGLKDEDKARLYDTMLATIQRRVANRIADALTDEQFSEWKDLDQAAKQAYLDGQGIDAAQIYLEETLFYKAEMVELAKAAQAPVPAVAAV